MKISAALNRKFGLDITTTVLRSRGYTLSSGVLSRCAETPSLLEPALMNLTPDMSAQMHALRSPSGLVGLPLTVRKIQGGSQEICLNGEATSMNPDKPASEYEDGVRSIMKRSIDGLAPSSAPSPTTKYVFDDISGEYRPVEFQGITIISPPYEDTEAIDGQTAGTYASIAKIQQQLLQGFTDKMILRPGMKIPKIRLVPPGTFHVTLADLIYADKYTMFMRNTPAEEAFLSILSSGLASFANCGELNFKIAGLMIMGDAVGARILPVKKSSYETLLALRSQVYDDQGLQELGLTKSGSYFGHITLGYLPDPLLGSDILRLSSLVCDLNREHFNGEEAIDAHRINVRAADVRFFPNMDDYNPLLIRASFV